MIDRNTRKEYLIEASVALHLVRYQRSNLIGRMTSAQILQNQAKTLCQNPAAGQRPGLDQVRLPKPGYHSRISRRLHPKVPVSKYLHFRDSRVWARNASFSVPSFSGVKPNEYRIQRADRGVVNLEQALKDVEDSSII